MSDTQIDAAADGAFSGKLADPSDTLTKRGGKGIVVYEGQEYDRLAWTRRCAALGYTLAAGEGAILNAALIEVEKERDALLAEKERGVTRDERKVQEAERIVISSAVDFVDALDLYDRIMSDERDGPYLSKLGDTQDALRTAVAQLLVAEAAS